MPSYKLLFHPTAKKELNKLDNQTKLFIINSLDLFINNYSDSFEIEMIKQSKIKKLKGNLKGLYRFRLRNYRVIYEKLNDKLIIYIVRIAHRKEVY